MGPLRGCVGECVSASCAIMSMFPHQLQRPDQDVVNSEKERRIVGFLCFQSFILEGLVSVTHFFLFSFFVFSFCTITFLVFVWSRTKKRKKQVSNNPVYKSVKTQRLYFEKVLYRSLSLSLSLSSPCSSSRHPTSSTLLFSLP